MGFLNKQKNLFLTKKPGDAKKDIIKDKFKKK